MSFILRVRHFYLRKFQLSSAVNPLKYSNVKGNYAVHSIGTVWANMLHNVHAALLAAHGYSETAFTNPDADADAGNVVFMRLFIDALAIQPCNPTCTYAYVAKWSHDLHSRFVNARDAWIQADANRYGGTHKCLIWKVFASKGLGANADKFVDNFDVPTECKDSAEEEAEPEDPEIPEAPRGGRDHQPGRGVAINYGDIVHPLSVLRSLIVFLDEYYAFGSRHTTPFLFLVHVLEGASRWQIH
ncbi:hypothetical protein EYR36_010673 [Pleurotus pulmonarius]|nr:hypothetical protein EYR36_010673 [Pleurotus pulmonarius]KAF4590578.1 hypothetical protein EYR38_009880 [Pleurotus pulmonarius]